MKLKVLIAEDEPAHEEAIRRALSKADGAFEIQVAGTLQEFRGLAAVDPPDIALLDLNLPDGRAVEVLTFPPEAGPFPVLIMTSFGSEQAAEEAMKCGALDYLVKSPETFSQLQRIIKRTLREWRLLQEKKEAEELLRQSRHLYQTFLDSFSDTTFLKDEQFRHLILNERLLEYFGKPREEVIGKTDFDLMPAALAEKCRRSDKAVLAGEAVVVSEELVGDRIYETTKFPVQVASNRRGIGGYIRDITARRQAEEALRESTEMLQAHQVELEMQNEELRRIQGQLEVSQGRYFDLYNLAPVGYLTLNEKGLILEANLTGAELLGQSGGALINQPLTRFILPEDQDIYYRHRKLLLETGAPQVCEMRMLGRADSIFWVRLDAAITQNADGSWVCRAVLIDITARKQSEESLRESEARYRDLVENSQDLICTHDLEGKLVSVNEAAARNMGYDRGSLLNRNLRDFLDPAVRDLFAVYLSEIKETGRSQGVLRVLNASGDVRLWEYSNSLRTEGLAVPLVRGLAHDITERHRIERALLKSEAKYRRLHESMMDAFVSVEMTGRITEFNQAYEALLGYSKEELRRLTYMDLTPERWHSLERDLVNEQVLVRGYSDIYEKEYRRKDGTEFPVEMRTFLIRDSHGRPEGMWAIVRDISERKRGEEALRKAEEKYSKAFQASPDWGAITTLDEGVLIEVNKAFERLSGFERKEVLGRTTADIGIWDQPEERRLLIDLMRDQGAVHNKEVHFRLKNGAVQTFMLSAETIELEGQALMLTVARDMTELRSLEAQFRQAQKMEAVGRLAGGVAHDFNNMLGVILGYTDLALKRVNAQEPLYQDLQEVNNAARRSADLTRQLLAFSRKQMVTPRVLNLNEAITHQHKMLRRLIGEDIYLQFIPGQDLWNIRLDPSQVDQVLANLAVNARDAIAGVGTVTIETANVTLDEGYTRRYRYVTPGDYVLLTMSDSGCGMDGETLETIFEPFFTTKAEGQGTGLGLSTVYGIVKQNKGSIQVSSEPGRGTTFKIYFPRFPGEAVPEEQERERPLGGSETVLIVEDEPQILLLAKRILEHYGYETVGAGSPGEALLLLEKYRGPLDLLLTDVIMPHMTGPELKARVESLHPGIKTVFMSGYTADVIAQRGLLDKGLAFIQKPFTVQDLAGMVRKALDG